MGFYGNITNTSKTTFSFDLIYDTRTEMDKNANVDDILATLKSVDEIKIQLDEETVLRLHHNNRYMINDELYGFNATDTEAGFTEDKGKKVSVNFTGEQLYRKYIQFLLNL